MNICYENSFGSAQREFRTAQSSGWLAPITPACGSGHVNSSFCGPVLHPSLSLRSQGFHTESQDSHDICHNTYSRFYHFVAIE